MSKEAEKENQSVIPGGNYIVAVYDNKYSMESPSDYCTVLFLSVHHIYFSHATVTRPVKLQMQLQVSSSRRQQSFEMTPAEAAR